MVLFRKGLDLKIQLIFLDLEGKSVVLNMKNNEGSTFKLVVVYVPTGSEQPDFFRHLEIFLGMSHSFVC